MVAEPHRANLIPHFYQVKEAAINSGALACSISGSGPSIFALAEGKTSAIAIATAMQKIYKKAKIKNTVYVSRVNLKGVQKIKS